MKIKTMNYIEIKFYLYIKDLTVGEGDIRKRLSESFFHVHTLQTDDFPLNLRESWHWIYENMTKSGPIYDMTGINMLHSSVQNTMKHIRNKTGAKIATRIVELHRKIGEANSVSMAK